MNIGDTMRNIRKQKGMTLQQLADILGCSQQNISQYESGKRTPKLKTVQKIADALNVNVNDLLESPLDDSSIYQVLKNVDYSDSPVSRNFINAQLTIQIHDWELIDIELVKKFKQLNEIGKAIAIERIEELSEIPRYTQKESNVPDKEE